MRSMERPMVRELPDERTPSLPHAQPRAPYASIRGLLRRLRHRAPLRWERREGERDRHRAEADAERADIEPTVASSGVEDPAADRGAERHAEARKHGGRAEHRAHDAHREIL